MNLTISTFTLTLTYRIGKMLSGQCEIMIMKYSNWEKMSLVFFKSIMVIAYKHELILNFIEENEFYRDKSTFMVY